ncbi:MAG: hypothetical protein KKA55_05265 [Proteobacteria bacterium]|nr:hypothetical protein [Pseudomonadota bacterium]MBU1594929.1 hypothetical protein [Pseudomonadota bacterium]
MRTLLLLLVSFLMLGPPTEACAQRVKITYHAAETEPESAEENADHAEGRAVDINEVNKMSVRLAVDPSAPKAKREAMRKLLREIETSARDNREVELFMSPLGGFHRDTKTRAIIREATQEELDAHWDHIHMTIVK